MTAIICATIAGFAHAAPTPVALRDPALAAAERLEHLATERFGALSAAERMTVRAAPERELKWLGPAPGPGAAGNDVTQAEKWGPERTVRAAILRWLYRDPQAYALMDQSGLGIAAARISGLLDLSFLTIGKPITIFQCYIPGGIDASNSKLRTLDLRASRTGAVSVDMATIEGDLEMQFGRYASVSLFRAKIGGSLDLSGARVIGAGADSISAQEARIGGDAEFDQGFITDGVVDFRLARIGQSLSFKGAQFLGGGANGLDAGRAQIAGSLYWDGITHTPGTILDLAGTTAQALYDDRKSWPAAGNLNVDGFAYNAIIGGPATAGERLRWLALQAPGYRPRPYRQLAKVLREDGRDDGAIEVLIAQHVAQRRLGHQDADERAWNLLLEATIGYGYRPLRALWWIGGFVILGAILFGAGYRYQVITPTKQAAYRTFAETGDTPPHYPPFSALVYSLENFLPLVDLHQGDFWCPNPRHRTRHRSRDSQPSKSGAINLPAMLLRWYLWLHILAGWILTPLLFAGLSGLIRPG
ncbi:MAG TPA: hypothetical protein VMV27_10935 [Candidatus Binataceae bacterium]|nr:hypothetical protein [Candidatus Binataceae bacterium]